MLETELYEFWTKSVQLSPVVAESHVQQCLEFERIDTKLVKDLYYFFRGDQANGYRLRIVDAIQHLYHVLKYGIRDASIVKDIYNFFINQGEAQIGALKSLWKLVRSGAGDINLVERWFVVVKKIGFRRRDILKKLRKFALNEKINLQPEKFYEHFEFWWTQRHMSKKRALIQAVETVDTDLNALVMKSKSEELKRESRSEIMDQKKNILSNRPKLYAHNTESDPNMRNARYPALPLMNDTVLLNSSILSPPLQWTAPAVEPPQMVFQDSTGIYTMYSVRNNVPTPAQSWLYQNYCAWP